jgi:hypothetical protein
LRPVIRKRLKQKLKSDTTGKAWRVLRHARFLILPIVFLTRAQRESDSMSI